MKTHKLFLLLGVLLISGTSSFGQWSRVAVPSTVTLSNPTTDIISAIPTFALAAPKNYFNFEASSTSTSATGDLFRIKSGRNDAFAGALFRVDNSISNKFYISGNGYVGIGATPQEALQIGDRFTFHNGGFKGMCYNFTYNGGDKRILSDYSSGIFLTNSGSILFRTAPTGAAGSAISWLNNMTVYNDGKVLIGNPGLVNFKGTPGPYLLYVQQGILTEKVKVAVATTTDWSDYVFANDYKLKSIKELEAFVKENNHLPNVPSAEEVVKEGVDMAKMDARLLEKIEELSLYIIQQDKRIDLMEQKLTKKK